MTDSQAIQRLESAIMAWSNEPPNGDGWWLWCWRGKHPLSQEVRVISCVLGDKDMVVTRDMGVTSSGMRWRKRSDNWFARRLWLGPFYPPNWKGLTRS
jgi:hypothetical protein